MKKYLLILFTVGLFTGCSKYDDGELWDSVNDLEARLSTLEKQCKEMNTNIESMKVIVDVLQSNDYITNVTVVTENGMEVGYKIDFKVHPSITIYHGEKGENGKDGQTPYIGENGNWWIDGKDTQVKARGNDGQNGETPVVGPNGNWWIGTEDTGIKAQGEDGEAGKDGITPVIGVKQDVDGVYYWTQKIGDDESTWILDSEGNKIKATGEDGQAGETPYIGSNGNWWIGTRDTGVKATGEEGQNGLTPNIGNNGNWWIGTEDTGIKAKGENGITPQLKIENDNWMLSVDNGQTWQNLGKAKGDKGDSFFKSVTNDVNDLTLVLEDGTVIKLPKEQEFSMVLDKEQFSGILAGSSYEINYTITSESERINIETIAPNDWKVGIQKTNNCSGKIIVTTPSVVTDGKILILVSDGKGKTTMRTVIFLKDNFTIDQVEYLVAIEGETIEVKLQTDLEYDVNIPIEDQAWIKCISKTQDMVELNVDANFSTISRGVTIEFVNEDGFVLETIYITQKAGEIFEGNIIIDKLDDWDNLVGNNYIEILGNLVIDQSSISLTRDHIFKYLRRIGGDFIVNNNDIKNFQGFENLQFIGGNFSIKKSHYVYYDFSSFSGLENLCYIGGDFEIISSSVTSFSKLISFEGLNSLAEIGGNFIVQHLYDYHINKDGFLNLSSFKGLESLSTIGGELYLGHLAILSTFAGLEGLQDVGKKISIVSCPNLKDYSSLNPDLLYKIQRL